MNMRSTRYVLTAGLAIILFLGTASCGRKTEPLTPDSPRPEAVGTITAVTRDTTAFLSWRIPVRNIEGRDMDPAAFQGFSIFRAEIGRDRKKNRYKQVAEISMAHPAPAEIKDGAVFWNDEHLNYGQAYGYRIRAISLRGGTSAYSEEVRVTPLLSLASPKNLSAQGADSRILLAWDSVSSRTDGSLYDGFVGYNVYRETEKGRIDETPVNKEPLRTNTFIDTSVVNSKTYYYRVRAVDSPARPWKESLDAGEVSATPRDFTPPERPTGITVVPGVGRVFLTWNENKERDLAGYHIYRSTKSNRDRERLTNMPINRTTFSDEAVEAGTTYYYAVTAVDKAGNESPPSSEQKATAEKLMNTR